MQWHTWLAQNIDNNNLEVALRANFDKFLSFQTSVYEICRKTSDDGSDATEIFPGHLDLMGDK